MDAIAVDIPVKAPTSSAPPPAAKPEAKTENKPEPAKAAKPPFPPASKPDAAPAPLPAKRKLLAIAAAVCSVIAGIAAVQMMSPTPKAATQPLAAEKPKEEAKNTQSPVSNPLTRTSTDTPVSPTGSGLPTVPVNESLVPLNSPMGASQASLSPMATAHSGEPTAGVVLPPIPSTPPSAVKEPVSTPNFAASPPVRPMPPESKPMESPTMPPAISPPISPLPSPVTLPPLPATNPMPAAPERKTMLPPPQIEMNRGNTKSSGIDLPGLPAVPPLGAKVDPMKHHDVAPAGASEPAKTEPAKIEPSGVPAISPPSLPGSPSTPSVPDLPKMPIGAPAVPPPPMAPIGAPAVPPPPMAPPEIPGPKVPPTIPAVVPMVPPPVSPAVTPPLVPSGPGPLPALPPSGHEAPKSPTLHYTKPVGTPEVKPAVATDRAAQTSFDVDLYEPKAADTYSTISKEFYSDAKYAAALQEYNGRRPLQGLTRVDVPPIHILKQRYPQLIGAAVPAAAAPTKTPMVDPWTAPAGATMPSRPLQRTFTVPPGGLTMQAIAKDTLGSITRWHDIYDLNPQLSPGDLLPAGTVVKIPTEVKPK